MIQRATVIQNREKWITVDHPRITVVDSDGDPTNCQRKQRVIVVDHCGSLYIYKHSSYKRNRGIYSPI